MSEDLSMLEKMSILISEQNFKIASNEIFKICNIYNQNLKGAITNYQEKFSVDSNKLCKYTFKTLSKKLNDIINKDASLFNVIIPSIPLQDIYNLSNDNEKNELWLWIKVLYNNSFRMIYIANKEKLENSDKMTLLNSYSELFKSEIDKNVEISNKLLDENKFSDKMDLETLVSNSNNKEFSADMFKNLKIEDNEKIGEIFVNAMQIQSDDVETKETISKLSQLVIGDLKKMTDSNEPFDIQNFIVNISKKIEEDNLVEMDKMDKIGKKINSNKNNNAFQQMLNSVMTQQKK